MTTTTLQLPPLPDLLSSLASEICPSCAGWKRKQTSLCQICRRLLSDHERLALYENGERYIEAMRAAMEKLNATEFRTVKVKS